MNRRDVMKLGVIGAVSAFSPQLTEANAFGNFFKRLARAVGIVTGGVLIKYLVTHNKIDAALGNALQNDLDSLRKNGLGDNNAVVYQTNGPAGLPGNRLMSASVISAAANTAFAPTSDQVRFLAVQNIEPPRPSAILSRAAFFNQTAAGEAPAKAAIMGPTLDGLILGSEQFCQERGLNVETAYDSVQRLLLPLASHKLAGFRDYRRAYKSPDLFDTADGRIAIQYQVVRDDEGVVLFAMADKSGRIVLRRQFVLDFRKRSANGFPLQAEKVNNVWSWA